MRITMNHRYPIRMQYLDSGNATNFTSPYTNPDPASPPAVAIGHSKATAVSPAVVAVIGVLAGAFLIISYYRIFLKYCNSHNFTIWGARSDGRNGGPSTIVLMEEHAWPPDASGLDECLVSRIPTCKYNADEGIVDGTECSVCLGEFEDGEELRILPKCNHPFHVRCIDTWLATSCTCPLCRINIFLAAAAPHALLPVEREPPAAARGPTSMSFIPAANANPINHEIEILPEQHVQEFLEPGQVSGPSRSPPLPSSRGSSLSVPDAGIPDNQRIDMPIMQHMRDLSLETSPTPTREIHVVNDSNFQPFVRSVSQQLNRKLPVSVTKQRLYSRARSSGNRPAHRSGDHKGNHALLPLSPQTKRFARLLAGSSTSSRSTGSSSMVVELLAQEIFQNNSHGGSDILETRVCRVKSSREASTSGTATGASRRGPRIRHDNASFELMWSIEEQENPLMWSVNEQENSMVGSSRASGINRQDSFSSEDEMEDLAERFADAMELRSNPGSDYEDASCISRPSKSLKRTLRSKSSESFGTWPSKRHSLKHSMARLKRYGSVSFRQNSFRRSDKVHASEPVFEAFEVD